MQGLISIEEIKRRFKAAEHYTRSELAEAFSNNPGWPKVNATQITRDIQAVYGHQLDRKSIPHDVAIELYLLRMFRMYKVHIEDAKQVSANDLSEFLQKFEDMENSEQAKWAYAEQFGGGEGHFKAQITDYIKAQRINRSVQGATVNVMACPA